eukprot:227396-Amphidinium_carterae.1
MVVRSKFSGRWMEHAVDAAHSCVCVCVTAKMHPPRWPRCKRQHPLPLHCRWHFLALLPRPVGAHAQRPQRHHPQGKERDCNANYDEHSRKSYPVDLGMLAV